MYINQLLLENFRSYQKQQFEFSPQANLILGPNGSGKTNILEAIYLLATGKSFRAQKLAQLVRWSDLYASIGCRITADSTTNDLEVQLISQPNGPTKRRLLIKSVAKTRKAFLGQLVAVIFHPEDIRLVTGSPSRRRDYLDSVFLQTQWRYASALSTYRHALLHRNELLDQIRLGLSQSSELFFWNQSLVKNAEIIHQHRSSFIQAVNQFFAAHSHPEISQLHLEYRPSVVTSHKLEANLEQEVRQGFTQIGPHRDDFFFENTSFPAADRDLAGWGSRGQQRLAVLGLKLAEIDFIKTATGQLPILLLDDIFSELDPEHRQLVIEICRNYQSILTSTDSPTAEFSIQNNTITLP